MNQARKRTTMQKVLSMILVLVMLLSLMSMSAFTMATNETGASSSARNDFMRVFHLDCGRKYFSVAEIKSLIDTASAANYTHIELAVGNDSLRFLLDDMSVTVDGKTYASDDVKTQIHNGNVKYYDAGSVNELSQSDMDAIIAYAQSKNISIIPLINTPGHMDAILSAATSLTGVNCSAYDSVRTIDVANTTAVAFTQALLQKYINYFAGKGCGYFNMGADEYANDKTDGFAALIKDKKYGNFVSYVNAVAAQIVAAGMTPIAFNDGIYYNSNTSGGEFSKDIVVSYWTTGWTGYTPAPASFIADKGHKILNTNDAWYYVLADKVTAYTYKHAQNGVVNTPVTSVRGDKNGSVTPIGAMICFWCDDPKPEYNANEQGYVKGLMQTLSNNNSDYFTPVVPQVETAHHDQSLTLGNSTILRLSTGLNAVWSVSDASVLSLGSVTRSAASTVTGNRVTVNALSRGTATVTAEADNGQSYSMDLTVAGEGDVRIDLTVGETWSKTMPGQVLSSYTHDDEVAKVNVTSKHDLKGELTMSMTVGTAYYIVNSEGKYLDANAEWVDDADNAAQWTWISHRKGFYLDLNPKGNETWLYCDNGHWTTKSGWTSSCSYFSGLTDGKLVSKDGDVLGTPITVGQPPINISTIAITGRNVGTTDVQIDGTWYHIVVNDNLPSDPLTTNSLTLEYMITTCHVHDYDSNSDRYEITSAAASNPTGVDVSTLAPANGYFRKNNSSSNPQMDATYWQTMRLDKYHKQAASGWGDSTGDGTTLTNVRYYTNSANKSAWQYQTADGIWHYFRSGDQLVAYYLQKTEVTKDVTTYTKDWGVGIPSDGNGSNGQVALTFAVVYPDNTVLPSKENMYPGSTTIYNYEKTGRDIGIIMPKENEYYKISKITVTDGVRTRQDDDNKWYKDDSINWNMKTTQAGGIWYDETVVWDASYGTEPIVNGKISNIKWPAKNTGKLVLIYLSAVELETNLNVTYWDDDADTQIYKYQIVAKHQATDPEPNYKTALMDGKSCIGEAGPWMGKTAEDNGYLPDSAYVVNASGNQQTISKDIKQLDGVTGNYKSGIYEYRWAEISEDGKTLMLHYDRKDLKAKTYVVDFGLPVTIPVSAFGIEDASTIAQMSLLAGEQTLENTGKYGTAKINSDDKTVTYTLHNTLDSTAAISLFVKFTNDPAEQPTVFSVNIIPATSVYYEDSFATFTNADGTNIVNKDQKTNGFWTTVGEQDTTKQQVFEQLKSENSNVYGYDPAYANCRTFSMGSATKVTVDANTSSKHSQVPTATFTFKGTGFDVISLTSNTSGTVMYTVTNSKGKTVKVGPCDTYYSDAAGVTTDSAKALYQIPVIKVSGLDYDTYTVKIEVGYGPFFDHTGNDFYSFWLDAIRVYDPMGKNKDVYAQDGEGYPQYIKLHDALVKNGAQSEAVFIDGGPKANVETYKNFGPNNEVYLAKGQAITFTVPGDANIASVQIGAKAPSGSAAQMVVTGGNRLDQVLSTATEMYYEIGTADGSFMITNMGDGILSLTNLKITFKNKPASAAALSAPTAEEQDAAVMSVRALFAAPEQTFAPEHFTAKWSRNVHKGGKATLTVKTSADVEAIHVDDATIDSYKVRTERSGWGSSAKKVTYHVFTYTVTATATADYTVCAINADGAVSDPITARLTVRPSIRDWWHDIFGKWQH